MSFKKARIAIFGGSFNPIHKGHVNIANQAIEELKLDELIFLPCYQSVDKPDHYYAPAAHRIAMITEVLPPKCSISTYEIEQRRAIETIETLKYFRDLFSEADLFFIMGADNLATIETWQDYDKLDEYANLVVFKRKGSNIKDNKGLKIKWIDNEIWDYSASEIRSKDIKGLDTKVEVYIRENKLYGYVG